MSQSKRKPTLNRQETHTLLNTLKVVTTVGAISMTIAGWGLLAQLDTRNIAQAKVNQPVAMVAPPPDSAIKPRLSAPAKPVAALPTATIKPTPQPTAIPTPKPVIKLDIAQWVQNTAGDPVAVVRDRRGNLWFVMGSDVPRIEQGQAPLIQPQPVRLATRSRAS